MDWKETDTWIRTINNRPTLFKLLENSKNGTITLDGKDYTVTSNEDFEKFGNEMIEIFKELVMEIENANKELYQKIERKFRLQQRNRKEIPFTAEEMQTIEKVKEAMEYFNKAAKDIYGI